MAKQLSVFLENRSGRMLQVASLLKSAGINILSFNLAETSDYGMLRLMVDDPEKGAAALDAGGFSAHLTDVMVVYIPARMGSLSELLDLLGDTIDIRYMYPYQTQEPNAGMVMKVSDMPWAEQRIRDAGYTVD